MTPAEQQDYWAGVPDASAEDLAAVFGEGAEAGLVQAPHIVKEQRYLSRADIVAIAAMHEPLRPMSRDEHRAMMQELCALHARPPRSIESVRSCGGGPQGRARQPARRRVRRVAASASATDGSTSDGDPPPRAAGAR